MTKTALLALFLLSATAVHAAPPAAKPTWTADNGNGTYTNPLFYDEFSDPDLIRVGDDFYLTGTTMHAMPGLAVLHSKDLVNWDFVAYALDKLDLGPQYHLEDGKNAYGQGIWAPTFRYHNGKFYIFSNVNKVMTQIFTATDPKGPWTHTEMKRSLHDLSVLFDDDGAVYVVWGYDAIHFARLTDDLTDLVPGSEKIIIPAGSGMGEGSHFYKIDGKYFITSAAYNGHMHMPAARADHPDGPWEVNPAISIDEDFGLNEGNRLAGTPPPFKLNPANTQPNGRVSLHQGGLVQTPTGQWWGFSMMDYNSVGRLTALSPVTWQDGWPYFGLPGNLTRSPRTWIKPVTGTTDTPHAPYVRSDDFSAPTLQPLWQWNHIPVDDHWSLSERPGFLRLHSLPATSLWDARNTLTQRAVGPQSSPTAVLDVSGLKPGDVAGLALLIRPYAWLGVEKTPTGLNLVQYDETSQAYARTPLATNRVWLRADSDYITETTRFSYATDGKTFTPFGADFTMIFDLITFQGVRYALFNYNTLGADGGYADFDDITIAEPHPHGLMRPIPYGKTLRLTSGQTPLTPDPVRIVDRDLGRVALQSPQGYLTVKPDATLGRTTATPGQAETFQWIETPNGDLVLMSLATNRFLRIDPQTKAVTADSPGPKSDGSDGDRFTWTEAK